MGGPLAFANANARPAPIDLGVVLSVAEVRESAEDLNRLHLLAVTSRTPTAILSRAGAGRDGGQPKYPDERSRLRLAHKLACLPSRQAHPQARTCARTHAHIHAHIHRDGQRHGDWREPDPKTGTLLTLEAETKKDVTLRSRTVFLAKHDRT